MCVCHFFPFSELILGDITTRLQQTKDGEKKRFEHQKLDEQDNDEEKKNETHCRSQIIWFAFSGIEKST